MREVRGMVKVKESLCGWLRAQKGEQHGVGPCCSREGSQSYPKGNGKWVCNRE